MSGIEYVVIDGKQHKVTDYETVDWDDGDILVHLWYEDPNPGEDD